MAKIAFVGLGIMGKPMSKNLLKAGHSVVVFDVAPAPVADVVAAGGTAAKSSKEAALQADVIITMLPDGPEVEAAVLGPGGILEGAAKGSTVVDMSLSALWWRRKWARLARPRASSSWTHP